MGMVELPTYDPETVIPMREELRDVGFRELLTPEEVASALPGALDGSTTLVMINSVCGCAAGNARPGVGLALQNDKIPTNIVTVFAGMEKAAVREVRKLLEPNLPSSPSMALFKDGKLVYMMHRHDIETRSAVQVAELLVAKFNEFCDAQGPSIPPEQFEKLEITKLCGSKLPLFQAHN